MPDSVSNQQLKSEIDDLRSDVIELRDATKDLVDAWKAAGKTLTFIKYMAGISTALATAWTAIWFALTHAHR
jgi:hypothetical protein